MTFFERFKDCNVRMEGLDSFNYARVKEVLEEVYNWNFLPNAALDSINRNSYSTVETVNFLHVYKYAEPEELVECMSYVTGLDVVYEEYVKVADNFSQISEKLNIIVSKDANSVDNHVYMGLDGIRPEPEVAVNLVGRKNHFHYLLPLNFKMLKDPSYMESMTWNYYDLFGRYMQYCLDNHASDIHFDVCHEKKKPSYRAMVRIGPDREECKLFNIDAKMNKELIRYTITERSSNKGASMDIDSNAGVVVDIKDVFGDGKLSVRFDAAKVWNGYYCVNRLQEQKTISLVIDSLGFDEQSVKLLIENTEKPSGLTLFTGKIRTGKNTTMNAVANEIVLKAFNPSLLSLESPIEILCKFPQFDYGGDPDKLNNFVRLTKKMDLDFVLLNEIPNAAVAFAVRDLVNSSIHTMTTWHMNRLWHLPHKLFEYFGESYRDVLSQVNLVCNQRLYKRQCQHCLKIISQERYRSDSKYADSRIYGFLEEHEVYSISVSEGCEMCNYTGYEKGSVVVLPEILKFNNDFIQDLYGADRPYEMEKVIFKKVYKSHFSLENQMVCAIKDGRLSPKEILTII